MRQNAELEWTKTKSSTHPESVSIFGNLVGVCVKDVSPNCKNFSSGVGHALGKIG
jgi:hypothetical protein